MPGRGASGWTGDAEATGFDISTRTDGPRTNWAFVSLFDKGRSTFSEIDLTTGQPITTTAPVPGSGKDIATRPHVTDIELAPAQPGFSLRRTPARRPGTALRCSA